MKYVHKDLTKLFAVGRRLFIAIMSDNQKDGRMFVTPCIVKGIQKESLYVVTEDEDRESLTVGICDRNISLTYDECKGICDRHNADWIAKEMMNRRDSL